MPSADLFNETAPARLQPVDFDFAAAAAAASALHSVADAVDRAARLRAVDARSAERDWTGGQRSAFDADENRLSNAASALVTRLRADASALRNAGDRARAANARRARGLTLWTHQQQSLHLQYEAAQARAGK